MRTPLNCVFKLCQATLGVPTALGRCASSRPKGSSTTRRRTSRSSRSGTLARPRVRTNYESTPLKFYIMRAPLNGVLYNARTIKWCFTLNGVLNGCGARREGSPTGVGTRSGGRRSPQARRSHSTWSRTSGSSDRKAENQGVPSGSFPRMKKPTIHYI